MLLDQRHIGQRLFEAMLKEHIYDILQAVHSSKHLISPEVIEGVHE